MWLFPPRRTKKHSTYTVELFEYFFHREILHENGLPNQVSFPPSSHCQVLFPSLKLYPFRGLWRLCSVNSMVPEAHLTLQSSALVAGRGNYKVRTLLSCSRLSIGP